MVIVMLLDVVNMMAAIVEKRCCPLGEGLAPAPRRFRLRKKLIISAMMVGSLESMDIYSRPSVWSIVKTAISATALAATCYLIYRDSGHSPESAALRQELDSVKQELASVRTSLATANREIGIVKDQFHGFSSNLLTLSVQLSQLSCSVAKQSIAQLSLSDQVSSLNHIIANGPNSLIKKGNDIAWDVTFFNHHLSMVRQEILAKIEEIQQMTGTNTFNIVKLEKEAVFTRESLADMFGLILKNQISCQLLTSHLERITSMFEPKSIL